MGFRYRKSIRLGGGFRINISGSGIGYSWGVPGYRISKTANGKIRQTASIPGTGLSYSTEESIHKSARKSTLKEEPYTDTEVFQSTDRADYKESFIVGAIGLLALIVLHTPQRLFLTIFSFIAFLYAHYIAPVNLEYDFTDEQLDAYEEWYKAWRKLFACDAVFYVPETYTNSSAKKNGGAEKTVSEEKALGMPALPYFLRTNVPVFSVALNKKESLYIFPDKVFYLHNNKISAYDLSEVSFDVDSVNYITDQEHLPADSKVVKETWLRVNADGSPDRRYKNNQKCLVCEYGRMRICSDSGLNIYFLLSNSNNVDQFKAILPQ